MDVFDILDLISGFGSRRRSDSCPKRRKSSLHYLEEKRGYNKEGDHPPLFSMSEESKNIFNKLSKNKAKYQCLFDVYSIILGQYVSSTDDQEDKENVKETMFQQRIDDLWKYFENENLEIKDKDYKLYTDGLDDIMYVKGKLRKFVYDTTPNSSEAANGELIKDLYLNPFKFK